MPTVSANVKPETAASRDGKIPRRRNMLPCTRFWGSTSSSWQEILHVLLSIGGSIKRLNDTVQEGCLSGLTDAASCLPFTLLLLLQRARKARNMA